VGRLGREGCGGHGGCGRAHSVCVSGTNARHVGRGARRAAGAAARGDAVGAGEGGRGESTTARRGVFAPSRRAGRRGADADAAARMRGMVHMMGVEGGVDGGSGGTQRRDAPLGLI
jgi:hypothetical protein